MGCTLPAGLRWPGSCRRCSSGFRTSPLAEKAIELEHQGDDLLRDVNRRLDTAVVTPFDREDIHELLQSRDTAVDHMQAAVDLLRLDNIVEPIPQVAEFGDLLAKAGEETVAAMSKLKATPSIAAPCSS